jgi:hypothetical protein
MAIIYGDCRNFRGKVRENGTVLLGDDELEGK